jgi:hypothetical protein
MASICSEQKITNLNQEAKHANRPGPDRRITYLDPPDATILAPLGGLAAVYHLDDMTTSNYIVGHFAG